MHGLGPVGLGLKQILAGRGEGNWGGRYRGMVQASLKTTGQSARAERRPGGGAMMQLRGAQALL